MSLLSDALRRALQGGSATFELPQTVHIARDNARAVLSALFEIDVDPLLRDLPTVRALASRVDVALRDDRLVFTLDDDVQVGAAPFFLERAQASRLACGRCRGPACPHALAVALLLAWLDPTRHAELTRAAWRTVLAPLAAAAPAAPVDDRPEGWLEVGLHRWPQGDERAQAQAPAGGHLVVWLVPTARSNGRPLAPREAPRSLSALEGKVRLSEADRALARMLEQRRLLGHIGRHKYQGSAQVDEEIARLDAAIFAALAGVRGVHFDAPETALQVRAEPWRPTLRIDDAPDGGLTLRFVPAALATFPVGPGWVVTEDLHLVPLAADFPAALRPALGRLGLPAVHSSEVSDFIGSFLPSVRLPLQVVTHHRALARPKPVPVLLLEPVGAAGAVEALSLDVAFDYAGVRVGHAARESLIAVPDAGGGAEALARDHGAELALLHAQRHLLPWHLPARLEGEAALDFLYEVPPQLTGWRVEVDPRLLKRQAVGTLKPTVHLRATEDFFDLQTRFEVADWAAEVRPHAVIEAWRAGRRYVALSDGRLARLPEAWLQRHGGAVAELEDIRRAAHGRLGGFAAGLARDLIAEADDDEAKARWSAMASRVVHFDGVPERDPPAGLNASLRSYQRRGYAWLCALYRLRLGMVLADDMGLGKTLQTLSFLLAVHRPDAARPLRPYGALDADPSPRRPSLVVAPTSVLHEWMEQAARFTPSLRVALHHGPRRAPLPPDLAAGVDLVITSHALVRREPEAFGAGWQVVVLDEAQAIKNPGADLGRALRALPAEARVALSGTPIENHPVELWPLFQFLMPGFFGALGGFVERYARPIVERQSAEALEALRRRIRPFVLRRLKHEVAPELPARQVQVLRCTLSAPERALYNKVRETYRDLVLDRLRNPAPAKGTKGKKGAQDPAGSAAGPAAGAAAGSITPAGAPRSAAFDVRVLEALTRLRQACCDAALLPFPEAAGVETSAKRLLLAELLAERVAEGHRTLVFSQWTSLLDRVEVDLEAAGHAFCRLDGATADRAAVVRRFQDPDGPPVFLLSLKAGGTGLNLTAADCVVHLDPWFNPAAENQASDRAHRIGQTRPVVVYKLVAEDTVEEKILSLQSRKADLAAATLDADRMIVEQLSLADLAAVFDDDAEPFSAPPPLNPAPPPGLPAAVAALAAGGARLTRSAVRDALNLPDAAVGVLLDDWVRRGLLAPERKGESRVYRLLGGQHRPLNLNLDLNLDLGLDPEPRAEAWPEPGSEDPP